MTGHSSRSRRFNSFFMDDDRQESEPKKEKKVMVKIDDIRKMTVIDIVAQVIKMTSDEPFTLTGAVAKFLKVLSEKLLITPTQALFLSIIVDNCDDDDIRFHDLAQHFEDCKAVEILKYKDDIDDLVKKGVLIKNKNRRGNPTYRILNNTVSCICKGFLPQPGKTKYETLQEWIESIDQLLDRVEEDELEDHEFESLIKDNLKNNEELSCVRKIRELNLAADDLKLYLIMCLRCILHDDNCIVRDDLSNYFNKFELRSIQRSLERGTHPLMERNLIEHVCECGQAEPKHWCLTQYSKSDILAEFDIELAKPVSTKLKKPDSIVEKTLYYDDEITRQIDSLRNILEPERMNRILNRLADHGMRKGFACLFYGGPGTGKTETVLQLARLTGRSIMQVDIASVRDKYVGETEKRIKAYFDMYRKEATECELAPILFFNEADALFTKRNENAENGVDKMENAMQNIILQEMENLEGILIATTNLTGSLDPAFERRFLYKIEFAKPSPATRCHIWQAMMPELSDKDALALAERFDFSGGQIENIARKRVIDDILAERDTIDIDAIIESCQHESLNKKDIQRKVGFV